MEHERRSSRSMSTRAHVRKRRHGQLGVRTTGALSRACFDSLRPGRPNRATHLRRSAAVRPRSPSGACGSDRRSRSQFSRPRTRGAIGAADRVRRRPSLTFVHVTRDLETFTKEELELHVSFFCDRCGDALVRNPPPDDHLEGDPAADDEAALYAVEALRDPAQSKSLVGFREEKRVLVYFLKTQKKAKASARR